MSEIAKEADISKALLFHYFKNKKEFYLYLYTNVFNLMREIAGEKITSAEIDLFEGFLMSLKYQHQLIKLHVHSFRFMMKAFNEEDEEVAMDLIGRNSIETANSTNLILEKVDKKNLRMRWILKCR